MIRALLCLAIAASAGAQSLPPGKAFAMTKEARLQLDTMAAQSIHAHSEASACVVRSAMMDSTFVIVAIAPAKHIKQADSLSISADGPICEAWQPAVHTHILDNGYLETPSPIDFASTARRGIFAFLVSVKHDSTWTMQAYP